MFGSLVRFKDEGGKGGAFGFSGLLRCCFDRCHDYTCMHFYELCDSYYVEDGRGRSFSLPVTGNLLSGAIIL